MKMTWVEELLKFISDRLQLVIAVLVALVLVIMLIAACAPKEEPVARYECEVYIEQGCAKMVVASGGELEVQDGGTLDLQESVSFTLGADEKLLLDGDTTNQTQTAGTLDINVGTTTANVSGFDVSVTTDDGTTAATDVFAGKITMVQNDADGDAKGLTIIADATTNAAANSYEYGISYDCEENTAGACPDGILLTSTGAASGMTDAIDASASNIVNAINIGSNLILGGDDSVSVGATDDTLILTSNDATATFVGADAGGAADTVYDTTGAGAITIGSADVTTVTVTTDGTGDGELAIPENSIGPDELAVMVDQVIFCGDNANNGTIYGGPATAWLGADGSDASLNSTACQALDNATEATADAPIGFANTAFKVLGMLCEVDSSGSNGVTLTLRDDASDLTPSVTCTIATGETTCTSVTASTTDVAAGSAMAVKSVTTEDLSGNDFWCKAFIAYK